ncbi:site-specific tyrosine recombinase/integron integrase [Methanobrevibacter curvatus]|uniref:Tyrosine recombinase XerC n=1 Tax=Methanobrevibacter curvatus TaxID=49547 RepID=A0A166BDE6_9EURY|nr:site-specific tyrosine recombinase/integron integrase [Methanobrevibacter curvatus]KZX13183.1 tyrosine recombinase XerC [Methanobrevibacter curvatus]
MKIISEIQKEMESYLNPQQNVILSKVLCKTLKNYDILEKNLEKEGLSIEENEELISKFLSSKRVEGCSQRTLIYYKTTIEKMIKKVEKRIDYITTEDLRDYLGKYRIENQTNKTTIDNIRRIFSSFFSWLEDEDYILKNPVKRIHKIKQGRVVREVLSDETLEILRDNCEEIRDLAMIEMLISTGMRVGELVNLNIDDVNFYERECVVFGKGENEREVYFDARCKIHLMKYLESRSDNNPSLFVSFKKPYKRLGISGVERRIRELGNKAKIKRVHPHKFRRTLATNAIDKGMPIEQVQKLLGHIK